MKQNKEKSLPSFWIPSLTPQAEKTKVAKPDRKVSQDVHIFNHISLHKYNLHDI